MWVYEMQLTTNPRGWILLRRFSADDVQAALYNYISLYQPTFTKVTEDVIEFIIASDAKYARRFRRERTTAG
jgi:hypothetical protein